MCAAYGDPRAAVHIFGATSAIHVFPAIDVIDLQAAEEDIVAAARRALGDGEFGVAWAEGLSITLEKATAEILNEQPTNPAVCDHLARIYGSHRSRVLGPMWSRGAQFAETSESACGRIRFRDLRRISSEGTNS